jgi:hypothetical protein
VLSRSYGCYPAETPLGKQAAAAMGNDMIGKLGKFQAEVAHRQAITDCACAWGIRTLPIEFEPPARPAM